MEIKINKANVDKVQQLKAALDYNLDKAVSGRDEKIDRYQKSYLYYLCKAPEKSGIQVSDYIEPVVRRAVEALKPSLMNIFTENEKKAVSFRPTSLTPPGIAELIDNTINNIFLCQNDGYDILDKAITECLITGDTFLKIFHEEVTVEDDEFEVEGMAPEEMALILQEYPNTDGKDLEEREGLLYGTIVPKRIEQKYTIERVDFKDMLIEGICEDIQDHRYLCHRITKTVGELVEMGYPREKLIAASGKDDVYTYLSTEKLVNEGVFTSSGDKDIFIDENERDVYLYEHYIYSSLFDKKQKSKLYQVLATDSEVLSIKEVDFIPFIHGVVDRLPGSFWGISMYDKFYRDQDHLSDSERGIIDSAMRNTYDSFMAKKGGYDRASLLNLRPGAIVEVEEIGSVSFFPKATPSPLLSESIMRVSANVDRNIMSSVGVDVTGANMSATAAQITANSADLKDKVMAKCFAYSAIRPLFKSIYNLVRAIEGATQMPKVADFQVDVNTSNDDGVLAQQLVQLATIFAQLPEGTIMKQEVAKAVTGLSEEEVVKYFPLPAQPTEEDMAKQAEAEAEAKDVADKQKALLEAQVALTVAQVAVEEVKAQEMILDGQAERERAKEDSVRKFKALDLKGVELTAELVQERSITVGAY
ncbi:MAG: portal protein [Cetobacterium sp.]|uniref:portal protein n=1 Tax=Cetobacterium sp. TaxID=2071632 RepID=UPI003EE552D5